MNQTNEIWRQLKIKLGRNVSLILDTALACEPVGGLSSQWEKILTDFGISPIAGMDRVDSAKAQSQTKGAPVAEVQQCLERLVAVTVQVHPGAESVLGSFFSGLVSKHIEQYKTLSTYKPKAVGGGMFAFALATAQEKSQEEAFQGGSYVLRCATCGGPRLSKTDLVCEYCDGKTDT